jgi:Endosomal/lysosomal potassium channel TMEM175
MGKNRLEAFSDGVFAIIITIMVLELRVPHEASLAALVALWPIFVSYVLSFVFSGSIGIITTTCSRPSGGSPGAISGEIFICFSGSRSFLS